MLPVCRGYLIKYVCNIIEKEEYALPFSVSYVLAQWLSRNWFSIYIFFFLFFFFLFKELCRVNLSRYIAKLCFHHGLDGKDSASNVGDLGLISGSGRSTGKGNGNPLQYSCLENSMEREAGKATDYGIPKSQVQLSN